MWSFRKNNNIKKRTYIEDVVKEPSNFTQTMIFVEPMLEKLVKKGFTKYIKNDYDPVVYVDISKIKKTEIIQNLKPVLNSILNYLHLPPFICFNVLFENDQNNHLKTQNKVGQYQGGWSNKTITISINQKYSFINVLAIICHECTHYFMEYNNLNWNDTELNEERTDMMACLIGFSKILYEGYMTIENVEYHGDYSTRQTSKIGYIDSKDCKEIRELITYKRKLIEAEENRIKEIERGKSELATLIDLIKRFDMEIDSLNPEYNIKKYTNKNIDINIIQIAIEDIKSLNTKNVLNNCENAVKGKLDINSIYANIEKAEKLCERMQKIIKTLQI